MSEEPTPGTTGAEGAADPSKGDQQDPTPGTGEEKVTLTKAELDAKMAEIRRGVESSVSKKFADYDDLKSKAQKLEELEQANKTEAEKATERAAQLEKQIQDMTQQRQDNALRLAVITEAGRRGITGQPAEDAVALIDRASLELDDDGNPKNVAAVFEDLLKARPYLKGQSHGSADQGARGGSPQLTQEDLKRMAPEEIVKAKAEGRLNNLLGVT